MAAPERPACRRPWRRRFHKKRLPIKETTTAHPRVRSFSTNPNPSRQRAPGHTLTRYLVQRLRTPIAPRSPMTYAVDDNYYGGSSLIPERKMTARAHAHSNPPRPTRPPTYPPTTPPASTPPTPPTPPIPSHPTHPRPARRLRSISASGGRGGLCGATSRICSDAMVSVQRGLVQLAGAGSGAGRRRGARYAIGACAACAVPVADAGGIGVACRTHWTRPAVRPSNDGQRRRRRLLLRREQLDP